MNSLNWPESKLVRDFMHVLFICKFEEDPIKTEGATVLMEFAPKPKSSLSTVPLIIHIKFDQDWPTDLGDSIVRLLKILSALKSTSLQSD